MPADIPPSCCDPPQRVAVLQRYAILDTSPERDYDDLCRLAAQICRTPMAFIGFMDARRQWFKSELGFGVREIPLFASLCRHFCEDAETLLVPDTLLDERFCHDPLCVETPGVRFYAGAAIRSAGGVILGTLCVLDRKPGTLDSFQRESLAVLARQIMSMLERRRTEILLNEQRCFTFLRADLSAHMGSAAPLPLILRYCTEQLVDSLGLSSAQIWTLAPGENLLCLESSAGLYPAPDGSPDRMKVGESQIGRVALVRRPQVRNRRMNAAEKGEFEGDAGEGNLAFVGYPLVVADRMVGVLALFAQGAYSELILENLAPVAENIAHCIDRKQTEETLRRKEEVSRFLAKASAELAELVDFQSTLQKIAGVAVPDFADWCTVDLVDSQGNFRRLAAAHVDPAKVQLAHELMYRFPPRPEDGHGISKVCRTGQSEWVRDISDAMLEGLAHNPAHLQALRELGVKSSIVAPLVRRDMVFGALTFGLIESKRHFNTADLLAAEDLASRAAVTTESASLYQKLQQAHQHKDEFLATLAHELRNPLAPLRNALQMLQLMDSDSATFVSMRDLMVRQVSQMVRLIDDLLDVSRITRNRLELRRERVSLARVVEGAIETSRPLIDAAGHELLVSLPEPGVELDADPARLAQVLANLLNNAAKYTKPKGRIWLTAAVEGEVLVMEVRDNGIGISSEMLPVIFEMFTQVAHSLEDSQGGLGIGLTLVRRLVVMHGGFVEAHSPGPGLGSRFVVRLPGSAVDLRRLEALPVEKSGPPLAETNLKRRILVVDDNRDSAVTLAKLLRLLGHELHLAYDGREAVDTAAMVQPEVILLDIGMPKLNGYDAARIIRHEAQGRPLMLIAMTGWGQEEDVRRSADAGFDHHLLKPVDYAKLKQLLALGPV